MAIGSQIAALLTLGADGVAIGTRFLLSPESLYSDSQRQALIEADSSHSVRTMAFDRVRNTKGWPKDVDGRALRNGNTISLLSMDIFELLSKTLSLTSIMELTSQPFKPSF